MDNVESNAVHFLKSVQNSTSKCKTIKKIIKQISEVCLNIIKITTMNSDAI